MPTKKTIKEFKIKKLETELDFQELSISRDEGISTDNDVPVLCFSPGQMHYHIPLTKKSARKLRDWLDDFLKD